MIRPNTASIQPRTRSLDALKATSPCMHATTIPGRGILVAGGIQNSQSGFDPSPSSSAWMFDPRMGFAPLPDLPSGTHSAGSALLSGELLIIAGGLSKRGALNATQAFHLPTKTWHEIPDLPTPRIGLGLVSARGKVVAVGGAGLDISLERKKKMPQRSEDDPTTNVVEVLMPALETNYL